MGRVALDTSVLFAAAYRRDGAHADGVAIVRGIDDGTLPEAVVIEFVLAETLNGLTTYAGHDAAVDFLDRIETNPRYHVTRPSANTFATAKSHFRRYEPLSLVDACIVAHAESQSIEYLYAFDDDFDRVDGLSRLDTPTNPYAPR